METYNFLVLVIKFVICYFSDMAVQMSNDVPSTEYKIDPQFVATKFVDQYYNILENSPEMMHKFYTEQSLVTRKGPNGEAISMKTVEVSFLFYFMELNSLLLSLNYEVP